jgi:hypothetical protein
MSAGANAQCPDRRPAKRSADCDECSDECECNRLAVLAVERSNRASAREEQARNGALVPQPNTRAGARATTIEAARGCVAKTRISVSAGTSTELHVAEVDGDHKHVQDGLAVWPARVGAPLRRQADPVHAHML